MSSGITPKRVLVVDDEQDFCEFLDRFLSKRKYFVDVAYAGESAQEYLKNHKYDYIFFDCNLPGICGVDLARIITKTNPQAKKIMVSGYELINDEFAKFSGVDVFLSKPVSLEKIKEVLK